MRNEMVENFKLVKNIKETELKQVCIIENNNTKFLLKRAKTNDWQIINTLKNEVNALIKLNKSKSTPEIYYYKFDEEKNYFVSELIKGQRINSIKKIAFKNKVKLMINILKAVNEIHTCGIIHCDLKPENILININNEVKIIDFGIYSTSDINYFNGYGSVQYCSVEQLKGEKLTKQSDIYSLGIIFYEILNGFLPFEGSKERIIEQKLNGVYKKSNNVLLNLIYNKSMNIDTKKRYKDIEMFIKDLSLLLLK